MTGAVTGRLSEVFEKISRLHTKTSFSLAIILGDLFADPTKTSPEDETSLTALMNGEINIALPTYFTLGKFTLPQKIVDKLENSDGDEICPNLYFLGKRSTTKTSERLRIVTLGGSLDPQVTAGLSKDKYLPFHTEGDAKALHGANTTDILVTSHWPASVRSRSSIKLPEGAEEPPLEQCVADLCSALKPRYHFSTSDHFFFEREPFFHLSEDDQPDTSFITRFISLAAYNNPQKQKWLYAFTIDPNAAPPTTMAPGTTATPFNPSKKRQRLPDQEHSYSRFNNSTSHSDRHYRPHKRAKRGPPPGPGECFFCLSNPNLTTHLITSIANDTYLTTAKGPLSTSTTYPSLPFPCHILIIPLSHSPTLHSISPSETKISTYKEMTHYRHALHSLLSSTSKGALGAVTWEVSRADGIHVHWQFLPVPVEMVKKGLVEAAFKVEAENEKYPTFKSKEIGDGTGEQGDYFRVWIWRPSGGVDATLDGEGEGEGEDKGEEKELVLPLSEGFRFDLQFGRRVMAKLLGLEGRMNWRDCGQSDEEEKRDAEGFKEAFKRFDFSLEE